MLFVAFEGIPGHERRWRPQEEGKVQVRFSLKLFASERWVVSGWKIYYSLSPGCSVLDWLLF